MGPRCSSSKAPWVLILRTVRCQLEYRTSAVEDPWNALDNQCVRFHLTSTFAVQKRSLNVSRVTSPKRRRVQAEFTGAEVAANSGVLLHAEADRRMGLTEASARTMGQGWRRGNVAHSTLSILQQRLYTLVLGHEDFNDHAGLRREGAVRAASGKSPSFRNVALNHEPTQVLESSATHVTSRLFSQSQFGASEKKGKRPHPHTQPPRSISLRYLSRLYRNLRTTSAIPQSEVLETSLIVGTRCNGISFLMSSISAISFC